MNISFSVGPPEPTIICGISTGVFGSCSHLLCDEIVTRVVSPRSDHQSASGTLDSAVGFCRQHAPKLISDTEYEQHLQHLLNTDQLTRSDYSIRELSDHERVAVHEQFFFAPPDGPQGRVARWRRVAGGGRENTIDGQQWSITEARLVVAVYDGLNRANKVRFAALPAAVMFNVAARVTGLT